MTFNYTDLVVNNFITSRPPSCTPRLRQFAKSRSDPVQSFAATITVFFINLANRHLRRLVNSPHRHSRAPPPHHLQQRSPLNLPYPPSIENDNDNVTVRFFFRLQDPPPPFLAAAKSSAPPIRRIHKWMMPEYKCYWKVVGPDTKVAVAFGPVAAGKYGTDMTLMEGLHGKGDTYLTLLREATTALLNSYNSIPFPYPTLSVINYTNLALLGSSQQALMIELRFKRANAGVSGQVGCNFAPCS